MFAGCICLYYVMRYVGNQHKWVFAGEDIREENYIQKSEDNLIRIAKDSKYKIKNLKRSIIGLALIVLITSFSLGMILVQKCSYPKNYITAVDKEGTEMKTAELLSGVDGAFLFDYHTNEKFQSLTIFISEYHFGKLAAKIKLQSYLTKRLNLRRKVRLYLYRILRNLRWSL